MNVVPFVNGGNFPPRKPIEPPVMLLTNIEKVLFGREALFVTVTVYSPAVVGAVTLKLNNPFAPVTVELKLELTVAETFIPDITSLVDVLTIDPIIITLVADLTETLKEFDAMTLVDKKMVEKAKNTNKNIKPCLLLLTSIFDQIRFSYK